MNPKADIWMPLYVADYMAGTLNLNTEQHGAYLLMLMACWKGDGRLPKSDAELASIAKLSPARWASHRDVLLRFFAVDGDALTQKRVQIERQKAVATNQARSISGRKGALKRWQTDGKSMASAMANASQIDAPSPTPSQYSEPVGSGSKPPVIDGAEAVFALGLPMLLSAGVAEQSARSMLGFLRKNHGDKAVLAAIQRCAAEKALQPVEFLQGCFKASKRGSSKHTGFESKDYREGVTEDGSIA